MAVSNINSLVFTYGNLEDALITLGFDKKTREDRIIYAFEDSDAIIVLPIKKKEEQVLPWHLAVARHTVTEFGVAELADFEAALEKVAA
jgi:hypothetical protein